jgi:hypothetical protein
MEDHTLEIRAIVARRDILVMGTPSTEKTNDASRRACTATWNILCCVSST